MCPSAFSVLGSPGLGGGDRGFGQTYTETFLGQMGICVQNFIQIQGFGFELAHHRPIDRLNICAPIFI